MDDKQIGALRAALKSLVPIAKALIALEEALGDETAFRDATGRGATIASETAGPISGLDPTKTCPSEPTKPKVVIERETEEMRRKLETNRREVEEMRRKIGLST